jgi:hypothetical protein
LFCEDLVTDAPVMPPPIMQAHRLVDARAAA